MNQASQSLGQMPAGNNGESSCRFQFNPGDWYQKERQHNVHGLQHNDFIDVFEHCSFHDYWLDRVQKPICLMHFIGRTEPALLETGGGDQFLLSLVVFLSLYACQVGTGWTPLTYMSQVTLNRMEPVLRDISISCKLFQRPENCFDSAKTACVLVVLLCGEVVDIDTCSRAQ